MADLLSIRIDSPETLIWEGSARSVSSVNLQGPFDILPHHASFITIVEQNPILIKTPDGKSLKFEFDRSVIYTRKNEVTVYTHI